MGCALAVRAEHQVHVGHAVLLRLHAGAAGPEGCLAALPVQPGATREGGQGEAAPIGLASVAALRCALQSPKWMLALHRMGGAAHVPGSWAR